MDQEIPTSALEPAVRKPGSTKVRLGSAGLIGASVVTVSRGRCRRIGVLGALKWSREWPERTLCDVSKRLRFGRYRVNSGRGADVS